MKKIICPYHKDDVASMHVYEEYSHCFACGAHVKNEKVGVKNVKSKKPTTDVKAKLEYIQNLPVSRIRGLNFPTDDSGFYIVWPSGIYYKRRNFKGPARYTGPRGVKPPLFILNSTKVPNLVIVEGEINALSCYTVSAAICGIWNVCSPGAASELKRHINEYVKYKKIRIIVDHDPAGIAHGVELKDLLLKEGKSVTLITRTQDYNDLLQECGPESLREAFMRDII